jgi:uncharacterized membrane protein
MADLRKRSILKAISYRVTGTIFTILVSLLVSGQIKVALSIGVIELFTKIVVFYLHERVWNKIPFGRVRGKDDYQI